MMVKQWFSQKIHGRCHKTIRVGRVVATSLALSSPALGEVTLVFSGGGPGGLVLVLDHASGNFETQRQSSALARNFGPGGVPILPESTEAKNKGAVQAASLVAPPRHVIPSIDVVASIDEVGTRYAGDRGLRQAGLSVTEWLAFFRANIEIESGYNQSARSSVGAIGLGQLMPGTAAVLGVNPYDTKQNLDGSARYLLMLLERFGSKELALAGYNAGPEAVQKYGGIPPYKETRGHVAKVMAVYRRLISENG